MSQALFFFFFWRSINRPCSAESSDCGRYIAVYHFRFNVVIHDDQPDYVASAELCITVLVRFIGVKQHLFHNCICVNVRRDISDFHYASSPSWRLRGVHRAPILR